jgi:hypothetical protein
MTAALLRLVKRVTRQFGPHAADALVHAIRTWTIDPSNSAARARLVAALSDIARRAEGLTAQLALTAAAGVERYRRSVGSWERELMAARYAIPQLPTGDVRAAALATYLGLTEAAPRVVAQASRPERALVEVSAALECEARMLTTEALGPGERQRALHANAHARAACVGLGAPAAIRASPPEAPRT